MPAETPPRMRGRPLIEQDEFLAFGNTPAYAGKTSGTPCNLLHD